MLRAQLEARDKKWMLARDIVASSLPIALSLRHYPREDVQCYAASIVGCVVDDPDSNALRAELVPMVMALLDVE